MKLSLVVAALLLCSCAVGVSDPLPDEPATYSSHPKPPAPKAPDADAQPDPDSHCQVYSEWINDCLVTKVYCDGVLKDLDIKCSRGRPLWPWEYIPDPPPPWVDDQSKRK